MVLLLIAFQHERESVDKLGRTKNGLVYTFPFLRASNAETLPLFSHHNKRFINYVSCRNWAVRNPVGTKLDSLAWSITQLD